MQLRLFKFDRTAATLKASDFDVFDDKNDGKELTESQKKSTKINQLSDSLNICDEIDKDNNVKKQWNKNSLNPSNNSTLSLHIAAYENSRDTVSDDKNYEGLKENAKRLALIKKWKIVKQILAGTGSIIQNPFEFPRQEDRDPMIPEIAQFRASQKLLNPNTSDALALVATLNNQSYGKVTNFEKLKNICEIADSISSTKWQPSAFSSYDRGNHINLQTFFLQNAKKHITKK
uniref:Uncharacterized protein n=1 Tax=Panagrolaimus superbus TaxID=310955 RepID=A0A914YSW7_9BILA